uniref:Putative secreted protein n=1 Tax=Ixodes ricinus TaxID=34613 RepID=A0A6B0UDD4_IXORI
MQAPKRKKKKNKKAMMGKIVFVLCTLVICSGGQLCFSGAAPPKRSRDLRQNVCVGVFPHKCQDDERLAMDLPGRTLCSRK